MSFRLVTPPISNTLNDLERRNDRRRALSLRYKLGFCCTRGAWAAVSLAVVLPLCSQMILLCSSLQSAASSRGACQAPISISPRSARDKFGSIYRPWGRWPLFRVCRLSPFQRPPHADAHLYIQCI